MLRKIYLSPVGWPIAMLLNLLASFNRPFMVYGYRDKASSLFRKHTRIGSTVYLGDRTRIAIADHVWIWHHSVIDGSHGVTIGEGVQIGAWCGVFSHGSHISIRLLGRQFIERSRDDRTGYVGAPVTIGDYSFIGTGALIMPGATIGKGCIIAPNAVVSGSIPDYAIVKGDPAQVVGDTRDFDRRFFRDPSIYDTYYDRAVAEALRIDIESSKLKKPRN